MHKKNFEINENLRSLRDDDLLAQTEYLVTEERKNTILILRHLREIEIRRLFIDLGFSSMYEYCTKHLKYSEGQTQRRLSSARLLTELPEIENKIQAGDLNITSLSKIQSFLKIEKSAENELTKEEKLDLFEHLENKSIRELEKDLVRFSNMPTLMAEKFKVTTSVPVLGEELVEFTKFEALLDTKQNELLTEFKNLFAHELSDFSDGAVLNFLLEKLVAQKKKKLGLVKREISEDSVKNEPGLNAQLPSAPEVKQQRTHIPMATQRKVWARANSCCEHKNKNSQTKCNSKHALQIDHVISIALGGTNDLENLQLLCRNHNSRRAIKTFGLYH